MYRLQMSATFCTSPQAAFLRLSNSAGASSGNITTSRPLRGSLAFHAYMSIARRLRPLSSQIPQTVREL